MNDYDPTIEDSYVKMCAVDGVEYKLSGKQTVLLSITEYYWVLLSSTEYYWVVLSSTE